MRAETAAWAAERAAVAGRAVAERAEEEGRCGSVPADAPQKAQALCGQPYTAWSRMLSASLGGRMTVPTYSMGAV